MTARSVYIDGERFTLAPSALLGQGGEAEVYDLGDGRVLKWWKPDDHPDFDGLPAVQGAVRRRLAEQQPLEAASLHVAGDLRACDVQKRLGEIQVQHHLLAHGAGLDTAGPADQERHTQRLFIHDALII